MDISKKSVPKWARIVTLLLALANTAFGVMGYFQTNVLFKVIPPETGLTSSSAFLTHAAQDFSARNLAIGVALFIVALAGVPESIAIVMIIRALIESQSVILNLMNSKGFSEVLMPVSFLIVELIVLLAMIKVVKQREAHHD